VNPVETATIPRSAQPLCRAAVEVCPSLSGAVTSVNTPVPSSMPQPTPVFATRRKLVGSTSSSLGPSTVTHTLSLDPRCKRKSSSKPIPLPSLPASSAVHRCPYPTCTDAQPSAHGWSALCDLRAHIDSVHLSKGDEPPTQFLSTHQLTVCRKCRVLIGSRGCEICKGRAILPINAMFNIG
jgi:hypothetical protein